MLFMDPISGRSLVGVVEGLESAASNLRNSSSIMVDDVMIKARRTTMLLLEAMN